MRGRCGCCDRHCLATRQLGAGSDVLVGLLGMTLPDYATQIGLRYLVIPVMVIAAGVVAEEAGKKKTGK